MKLTLIITLDKFEPHTDKEEVIKYYDVGFTIVHEDGITMYAPTTIPFKEGATEGDVVQAAVREVLPGQIAIAYNMLQTETQAESDVN